MLQITGLASMLGVPLETVYPEQGNKLLPIYQNTFHPRKALGSRVVRTMWTNTNGWPEKTKEFVVNHFVLLFHQNHPTSYFFDSSGKTKSDTGWQVVKRRKLRTKVQKQDMGREKFKRRNKKQNCTKLPQWKVAERKTQEVKFKFEDEKAKRERHNTKNGEKEKGNTYRGPKVRNDKKQEGHGNKASAENEKKESNKHITPEGDQDTTCT